MFTNRSSILAVLRFVMAVFLMFAALGCAEAADKIVTAHVMHQMTVGAVNGKDQTHLSVAPSLWNGMMELHMPEYVANYGKPMAAARQDIAMMKAAGLNAMSLILSNSHLPNSQFAPMILAYYQAAIEDGGIKIIPDIWGYLTQPEPLASALALIKGKYERALLHRNGRIVISLWLENGYREIPRYEETVRRLFEKIGGREAVYLICYSPAGLIDNNRDWFDGADAFTEWTPNSYGRNCVVLAESVAAAKSARKPFWHPVMPSFTQARPYKDIVPHVREMLGMTTFRDAWMQAIRDNAPAVALETWNDLSEDSSVVPETNHGYAYHELTKYFSKWFKTGRKPGINKEQVFLFHHPQIVEGVELPAGRKPMEGFPVSHGKRFVRPQDVRTPPTDYVGVVAMLKTPAKVAVMLGEEVLAQREMPAGMNSWLIYQPRNLNDPRKLYACDYSKAYPKEERDLFITTLDKPLWDAEVYVSVSRGKERIGFFRSHRPIVAAAARGELTTIGDVFELKK